MIYLPRLLLSSRQANLTRVNKSDQSHQHLVFYISGFQVVLDVSFEVHLNEKECFCFVAAK